jgi:hypothetical protein
MRSLRWCWFSLVFAGIASAQTVRVSGVVVDERQLPIQGATVRLTGEASTTTRADGGFTFADAIPGRYLLTVSSIGFELRSIELTIARDTSLSIVMTRRAVTLDTVRIRPRNLRIKATAVDSSTGDFLLQAQATLYPGGMFVSGVSGVFVFDSVSPGPVTIIVEALEHLPARIQLDLARDTAFRVAMGLDSVALRMTDVQVKRLEQRTHGIPMLMKALNRDAIKRESASTLHELLTRRAFEDPQAARRAFVNPPEAGCYFVDDVKVSRGVFDAMLPELVERVEIYRSAGAPAPKLSGRPKGERNFGMVQMFRVYTKRYVATLPRQRNLPRIEFSGSGLSPTCS